jgi:WD40 repeat protein
MTSRGWEPGGGRPPAEIWRGSTESGPAFLLDAVPDRPADWLFRDAVPDRPVDRMLTVADRTLRFHGLEGGGVVRTLSLDEPFDRDRDDLVPCPAGQMIAVKKGARSELIVLDVRSGEARQRFSYPGPISGILWSPDGHILAAYLGTEEGIELRDVGSGERFQVLSGPRDWSRAMAFSPEGRVLAAVNDGHTLWLWDVATGARLLAYAGHEDMVHSIAFSPDGRQVATGDWDGEIATWDARTGRRLRQFGGHETGRPGRRKVWVAYHPDGRRLVTWSASGIRTYDLATGRELRHDPLHGFVAFGPGGEVYAATYDDLQAPQTLQLQVLPSGRDRLRIPLFGGRVRAMALDHVNQVFVVALQEEKLHTSEYCHGRIFAPPGLRRSVQWWTLKDGKLLHAIEGLEGSPIEMKFSPDGRLLVAACEDRQIRAWDVATGELRVLGPEGTSEQLAISADGRTWATRSDGDRIILWDAAEGQPRITATSSDVGHMTFSPDSGILVTAEYHEGIVLRDVETGAVRTRMAEQQEYYGPFAFSPDGSVLAAACHDTTVLLWDFSTIRHRTE